jgi:hypothetical protein
MSVFPSLPSAFVTVDISSILGRNLGQVVLAHCQRHQPNPECLEGTRWISSTISTDYQTTRRRVDFFWLHDTAGVGKSVAAFTVAERIRGLKATSRRTSKSGSQEHFALRKHIKPCTTRHFFATLVYQLASNFPSIRKDMNRAICDNFALLDTDKPLRPDEVSLIHPSGLIEPSKGMFCPRDPERPYFGLISSWHALSATLNSAVESRLGAPCRFQMFRITYVMLI